VPLAGLFGYFAVDDLRRAFVRRARPSAPDVVTLELEGLTCNNCVRKLESALRSADGVASATVTLDPSRATIQGTALPAALRAIVQATGYTAK
jgi:copper chaperone CopZ